MNTLLITGVTGFLGGAALEKILHQKPVNLLLLVRAIAPRRPRTGKENMRKFNIAEEKLAMLPRSISCWAISPLRSIFLTIRA
jgi:thioester reductase-like protein